MLSKVKRVLARTRSRRRFSSFSFLRVLDYLESRILNLKSRLLI